MNWLIALLLIVSVPADAKIHRSHAAVAHFVKAHPCPATGAPKMPCKGYIVDHIVPLCAGGLDDPANMQWQTKAAAHQKDLIEWATCRALKRK